eukprot:2881427-Amphidinium_carterae.2
MEQWRPPQVRHRPFCTWRQRCAAACHAQCQQSCPKLQPQQEDNPTLATLLLLRESCMIVMDFRSYMSEPSGRQ